MRVEEFNRIVEETLGKCRILLDVKEKDYSGDIDRLEQFKIGAALEEHSPQESLRGMMTKHVTSVYSYIKKSARGEKISIEQWDKKLLDNINYLILLRALMIEINSAVEDTNGRNR